MGQGVTFTANGGQGLGISNTKTTPDQPSFESGSQIKWADGGSGDMVNKAFDTSSMQYNDKVSHDTNSGKGVTFAKDLE